MTKINYSSSFLIPLAILLAGVLVSFGIIFSKNQNLKTNQNSSLFEKTEEIFKPVIGFDAPLFNLKTTKGIEINLKDLKGQNILLVFWGTWCPYSVQELPDLKKFTELYRSQIIVLAIDIKESAQTIKEYEEKEKINFTMLLDEDGAIAKKYQIDGTPYHFLINKEGKIVAIWPSYSSLENLKYLVKDLVQKSEP